MIATLTLDGKDRKIEIQSAPKDERALWLWIEMKDGKEFEAVYPGLDILGLEWPLTLKLRASVAGGSRDEVTLTRQDVKRISVLHVNGSHKIS